MPPLYSSIDGVAKELNTVYTDVKELSALSSVINGVEKTIFEKDIMERVSSFYLLIDSNAYYNINEDGSLGATTFINNASDLTDEEYANLIGKIVQARGGHTIAVESPRKKGQVCVEIWLALYAELKDGSRKLVSKSNGFPLRDFGLNFDLYGHYTTVRTPSDTNRCVRKCNVNYGDDESVEEYTNPFTTTTCNISSQNLICFPLKDQAGSYSNMFYIAVGNAFKDSNGSGYYHWVLNNITLQYLDKQYQINSLRYSTSKSKISNRDITADSIIGFDVFLTNAGAIGLYYRSGNSSGATQLATSFMSMSNWNSSWGTYSKTDTNLTVNAYTGCKPSLYFVVLARMANDICLPLSYFSYEQLSKMNIPISFIYTSGSSSSNDAIRYCTMVDGGPSFVSKSIFNTLGTNHIVNANGAFYYRLFDNPRGTSGYYSFYPGFYNASGESSSSSTPSPASVTRSFSITLGNATVTLSDESTKIVPMRFRISGETPTYLYDDIGS